MNSDKCKVCHGIGENLLHGISGSICTSCIDKDAAGWTEAQEQAYNRFDDYWDNDANFASYDD